MQKLLVMAILFLGFACKKNNLNECSQAVCPAVVISRPIIKFTFSDKITNKDLFFNEPPQYQLKDIIAFQKKNTTDTMQIPIYIDSINVPKHFAVVALEDNYTFFIQIQNQKADTIDLLAIPAITNCCPTGYVITSLKLNEKLICTDCALSNIEIKK